MVMKFWLVNIEHTYVIRIKVYGNLTSWVLIMRLVCYMDMNVIQTTHVDFIGEVVVYCRFGKD